MFIIGWDYEMVSQLWDILDMINYRKISCLICGNMLLKLFKDVFVLNNDDYNCDKFFKMVVLLFVIILDII